MTREEAIEIVKTQYSYDHVMKTALGLLIPELHEKPLTAFQQCLNCILRGVYYAEVPDKKVNEFIVNVVRTRTDELIKLAKKQEHTDCQLHKSKDEEIRQQLLWLCDEWEHNPEGRTIPADIDNIRKIRNWLEKQKESLHISESCKENADSFTIEEERIRKALIDALKVSETIGELKFRLPYPTREECIAYLEKQKEQKPVNYDHEMWKNCEANFEGGKKEVIDHPEKYGLQKEQKPVDFPTTDEEVNEFLETHPKVEVPEKYKTPDFVFKKQEYESYPIISKDTTSVKPAEWSEVELEFRGEKVTVKRPFYRDNKGRGYSTAELDEDVAWNALRAWCEKKGISLYDLYPKAEWSEDDETAFGDLMWCIEQARKSAKDENDMGNIWSAENWVKNRLKSLRPVSKESLQPHWKPSEEQMEALKELIDDANKAGWVTPGATELYEQLKKLM